jgi:hypothetical protein
LTFFAARAAKNIETQASRRRKRLHSKEESQNLPALPGTRAYGPHFQELAGEDAGVPMANEIS